MKLSSHERQVVRKLVTRLKNEFNAERVMLYGSAARGDMDTDSDIDLLIVLPEATWETEKAVGLCAFEAGLEINRIISTTCFSGNELQSGPMRVSPFVVNVMSDGLAL